MEFRDLIQTKKGAIGEIIILDYLENPVSYKENLRAGSRQGRTKGISTGYNWIANATIGVE